MKKKRNALLTMHFLLIIFWVVIASNFSMLELVIGFIVSSLIVFYNYDLIFEEGDATRITFRSIKALFVLFFTLIINIIKANIDIAKIVLNPKLPISPQFVSFKQPLKKDVNRALYGNAITLTPGTLTVKLDEDTVLVHALTDQAAKEVLDNAIKKRFIEFERATEND